MEELNSEALKAWKSAIDRFSELGWEVIPVSIPSLKYALSAYYVIATSEAASNLARYDGVRYDGKRSRFTTRVPFFPNPSSFFFVFISIWHGYGGLYIK